MSTIESLIIMHLFFLGSLTSGSSDIQGSIERLAEKWEAKRKSLIAVATNGSFDFEDGTGAVQEVLQKFLTFKKSLFPIFFLLNSPSFFLGDMCLKGVFSKPSGHTVILEYCKEKE